MDERIQVYETKMGKTLNALESELTTIRAGRANPHILDKLTVDYQGAPTPRQQDANDAFKKLAKQDVSEDEIKELEDQIQKLTDKYIKEVDKAIENKSKEILTV